MLLSICDFLQPEQYAQGLPRSGLGVRLLHFGPSVGNSWRTDTDVGFPGTCPSGRAAQHGRGRSQPQAAGPGHWNDPDYLAPDQGMSATQFRSQLSMWAMLAAPLMISDDLTKIGASSLSALQNTEVTAVDQDPAGARARCSHHRQRAGVGQAPERRLTRGRAAQPRLGRVANPDQRWRGRAAVGLSYRVRDLWAHRTSSTRGSIGAEVPGDGTVLLRVSAG